MYLPQADASELMHAYIYGLKDHVRQHVLLSNPANLQEAFTNSLTIDERSKTNYNLQIKSKDTRDGIVPMELGHTQFNNQRRG
jgi:hypothetical protein